MYKYNDDDNNNNNNGSITNVVSELTSSSNTIALSLMFGMLKTAGSGTECATVVS
jgi:hypothetical protein